MSSFFFHFESCYKNILVEAENATQHSLDADMLHDQKLVFFLYYFYYVSGGTITHTEICTRKEGQQLTRIIPYRLDLKKMNRRCCFLSLHLSFAYKGKIRLLYTSMNINKCE